VVIVDTTVWIDYLQGVTSPETDWVHAELDWQRLGLTDVILCEVLHGLCEVLHGVRDDVAAKDVERQLLKLEVFETGGCRLGTGRSAELPNAQEPRPHRTKNDRLSDRDVLHTRGTRAAAQ
jgi:hypothetical protein